MTEKIINGIADIGFAGVLVAAIVAAYFWHAEQRADIEAWKADRTERLTVAVK